MKKIFISMAATAIFCACSTTGVSTQTAGNGTAQQSVANDTPEESSLGTSLGGVLNQIGGSSATGGAVTQVLATLIGGSAKLSAETIAGTWNYVGAACVLESENALSRIGGTLLSAKVEEKMNEYLMKAGIRQGTCSFIFNRDKSCAFAVGGKQIPGTFELNSTDKTITFSFIGALSMTAYTSYSAGSLQLVFKVDKLLSLVKKASALSNDATVSTLSSLLSTYDGMMIGMKLQK